MNLKNKAVMNIIFKNTALFFTDFKNPPKNSII